MWWADISSLGERTASLAPAGKTFIALNVSMHPTVEIDDSAGPVVIGKGTKVCSGAILHGPLVIGDDCLIGSRAFIRGATVIGSRSKLGYCTEVKQALIGEDVTIGPMCFLAESRIDRLAYLGAMVRTSNQRLDRRPVTVRDADGGILAEAEKLGCWIGECASLGIQSIILPGRVVAPHTIIEPRVTITRNLPAGHYRLRQTLEHVEEEPAS